MMQSQTSFPGKPKCSTSCAPRFILFHGKRHPRDLGEQQITEFLTDLAVHRHVAASTQNRP
jgi:hypothetical protein